MANAIVQNLRGADAGPYGKVRRALNNEFKDLGHVFANPALFRSPDYYFSATTDDAVAFTVWDSDDPLDNANADVGGQPSPALKFPANTRTPVHAFALVANDDTIGMIGIRSVVIGSATAPTLEAAFWTTYTVSATYVTTSTVTNRIVTTSSPGTTMTHSTTGIINFTYPTLTSAVWVGGAVAPSAVGGDTVILSPASISTASGKLGTYSIVTTPANPAAAAIITATVGGYSTNSEWLRSTQSKADVDDTLLTFTINTASTPDSLIIQATGITGAELQWNGGVWIGDSAAVAFRTQV
jgi:hypothetical protein